MDIDRSNRSVNYNLYEYLQLRERIKVHQPNWTDTQCRREVLHTH